MALIVINWRPRDRQLRVFGAAAIVVGAAIGARLYAAAMPAAAAAAWSIACGCLVLAVARPALLRPLYLGLSVALMPIGYAVSYAALFALYFGMFLPIGLALRLCGRDLMARRRDAAMTTYWHSRKPRPTHHYFRMY